MSAAEPATGRAHAGTSGRVRFTASACKGVCVCVWLCASAVNGHAWKHRGGSTASVCGGAMPPCVALPARHGSTCVWPNGPLASPAVLTSLTCQPHDRCSPATCNALMPSDHGSRRSRPVTAWPSGPNRKVSMQQRIWASWGGPGACQDRRMRDPIYLLEYLRCVHGTEQEDPASPRAFCTPAPMHALTLHGARQCTASAHVLDCRPTLGRRVRPPCAARRIAYKHTGAWRAHPRLPARQLNPAVARPPLRDSLVSWPPAATSQPPSAQRSIPPRCRTTLPPPASN